MNITTITEAKPNMAPGKKRKRQVIIADEGYSAGILILEASLIVGSQFRWRGTLWEIVASRPHAKALVAHPIEH